jgi:hypothetical protein
LQWLQDNLNTIRREDSRNFRNKKRQYMNDRINELAMISKNKNIRDLYRGINEFKRGYHPRNRLVKDENGDLLADETDGHTVMTECSNCRVVIPSNMEVILQPSPLNSKL